MIDPATSRPVTVWPLGTYLNAAGTAGATAVVRAVCSLLERYWRPERNAYHVSPHGRGSWFYDDNAWIGLFLARHSSMLGVQAVTPRIRALWRFAATGWDNVEGGGIYWQYGAPVMKNLCTNGAFAWMLCHLGELGDGWAVPRAIELFRWCERLRDPGDGLWWDHVRVDGHVDKGKWSYNAGIMLAVASALAHLTGERRWLAVVRAAAQATERFCDEPLAFNRWDRVGHPVWFDVVLIRGLGVYASTSGDWGVERIMLRLAERISGDLPWESVLTHAARIEVAALMEHLRRRSGIGAWL